MNIRIRASARSAGHDQDQAVGADPEMPVADRPGQGGRVGGLGLVERLNVDVIVAQTVHLGEFHGSSIARGGKRGGRTRLETRRFLGKSRSVGRWGRGRVNMVVQTGGRCKRPAKRGDRRPFRPGQSYARGSDARYVDDPLRPEIQPAGHSRPRSPDVLAGLGHSRLAGQAPRLGRCSGSAACSCRSWSTSSATA